MSNQKDEEAKKLFASRLKVKLAERHMNQNTLADMLGMSESSIGKWTLGKSMPRTMGQIEKIAALRLCKCFAAIIVGFSMVRGFFASSV